MPRRIQGNQYLPFIQRKLSPQIRVKCDENLRLVDVFSDHASPYDDEDDELLLETSLCEEVPEDDDEDEVCEDRELLDDEEVTDDFELDEEVPDRDDADECDSVLLLHDELLELELLELDSIDRASQELTHRRKPNR